MNAGVILLSEDLHRVAYNAAFEEFEIRCNGQNPITHWWVRCFQNPMPVEWPHDCFCEIRPMLVTTMLVCVSRKVDIVSGK